MRRLLLALLIALWPVAATAQEPLVPVLVIDGKGFGHGVGMAQEGAFWMARGGATTEAIFGQFYPGAAIGRARGPVRVPVLDAGPAPTSVVLGFPNGGEVRESGTGPAGTGFPLRVPPGGRVRLVWEGRYRVEPLFAAGGGTAAPAPPPARSGCPSGDQKGNDNPCATTTRATTTQWELASSVRPQIPILPPAPTTTTTAPPETTTTSAPPDEEPPPTTAPLPRPTPTTTTTTTTPAPPGEPPPAQPGPGQPAPDQPPPPASAAEPTSGRPLVAVPAENGTVDLPIRQRRYRGVLEATATSGTLRIVNTVDVETYLKGMGEVRDPTWPPAALRAQAIAARTYALRAMAVGGEVCDTQRCQVYLGAQAEYGAMNRAVDDSREQVLVFNRSMISAVYSANGGGHSASRTEGFGVAEDASAPYLRAAPYPTQDPGPWTITVALTDVAARLGYAGAVSDVRVTRTGPSGRAIDVTLDGTAGPKVITGLAFDAGLGLRSTLFTLRLEAGAAPPPPPPAEEAVVQAPPDEAAAAVEIEIVGPTEALQPVGPKRVVGTPAPPVERDGMQEEPLLFAAWTLLAAVGSAVVFRPSRTRPSPSAPPSADGSP